MRTINRFLLPRMPAGDRRIEFALGRLLKEWANVRSRGPESPPYCAGCCGRPEVKAGR